MMSRDTTIIQMDVDCKTCSKSYEDMKLCPSCAYEAYDGFYRAGTMCDFCEERFLAARYALSQGDKCGICGRQYRFGDYR